MKPTLLIVPLLTAMILASCVFAPVVPEPTTHCTFSAGISCDDYSIEDGTLSIALVNGLGRSINVSTVVINEVETGEWCSVSDIGEVANGERTYVAFDGCIAQYGTEYDIELTYTYTEGIGIPNTIIGEVFIKSDER